MKKLILLIIALSAIQVSAQVGIGVSTANIDASAQLEVASNNKGFLAPRMTESDRSNINSPASGLLVYQTDGAIGFYFYDGTIWKQILGLLSSGTANQVLTSDGAGSTSWSTLPVVTSLTFVDLTTNQTIEGTKTFSSDLNVDGNSMFNSDIFNAGSITSAAFVKNEGTSSQFLKADGSVDDNNYITAAAAATVNALKANIASPTFTGTVSGISKSMVGLGNVDNTSDANKPISNATQSALGLKESTANKSDDATLADETGVKFPTQLAVKTYVDYQVSAVGSNFVDLTNNQTIAGNKSFSSNLNVNGTTNLRNTNSSSLNVLGDSNFSGNITNAGQITSVAFIKSGGTATQFLKADGTVDTNTYLTSSGSATNVSGIVAIANGGTGVSTITGMVKGNGTSPMTVAVPGTDYIAPVNIIPQYRVTLGSNAGINTTSGYSVSIGRNANQYWNGSYNTAVGSFTLETITTGSYNQAFGDFALQKRTSGSYGTAIGAYALQNLTTGSFNTSLGTFAGNLITIGTQNTLIGHGTNPSADNGINQIVIGYNATGTGDNTVQLGNSAITSVKTSGRLTAGAVTYPNTDGTSGQVLSTNGSGVVIWSNPTQVITEAADEFTAQAGDVGFTLTHIPASISKVKMFINGIRISNTAYSFNGTSLTYDPSLNGNYAISVLDRIQFDYSY